MVPEAVRFELDDGVAVVTLDRAERLNALDAAGMAELRDRLGRLAADDGVRAVVLTGAGRGFCAGGDVASLTGEGESPPPGDPDVRRLMDISLLLHTMPKVTLAAVNGPCAGAGLGFAAACDLRVAASSAVFASAFLRVGQSGDHGTVWSVTRAVGPARARALFLLGERMDAEGAERIGLVHWVVPDGELLPRARQLAGRVAALSPAAVAAMKANLDDAPVLPLEPYLDRETERFLEVSRGPDAREAALAYLEKREPVFR